MGNKPLYGAGLREALERAKQDQGAALGEAVRTTLAGSRALVDSFHQGRMPSFEKTHTPIIR